MVEKRKKLESNQVLGPDITEFLAADKGIMQNIADGQATVNAISKTKGPGKHFGAEE